MCENEVIAESFRFHTIMPDSTAENGYNSDVEPDSLCDNLQPGEYSSNSSAKDQDRTLEVYPDGDRKNEPSVRTDSSSDDPEIERAFAAADDDDDEEVVEATPDGRVIHSRASLNSQKSVCYFVGFSGEEVPSQQVHPAIRPPNGLTKSMFAKSEDARGDQSPGVSFFVDLSGTHRMPRSHPAAAFVNGRVTSARSTRTSSSKQVQQQKPAQSRGNLVAGSADKVINEFFAHIQERLDFLSSPCFSREEVREKLVLATNIQQLVKEEEEKAMKGLRLTGMDTLVSSKRKMNRMSSTYADPSSPTEIKPSLRRERTFDLDPGTTLKDIEVFDICLDEPRRKMKEKETATLKMLPVEQERLLRIFRQEKLLPLQRLQGVIDRLAGIDRELSLKTSYCGPERIRCWEDLQQAGSGSSLASPIIPAITPPAVPVFSPDVSPIVPPVPRPRTKVPAARELPPVRPARRCDSMIKMTRSCNGALDATAAAAEEEEEEALTTLASISGNNRKLLQLNLVDNLGLDFACCSRSSSASSCSWFIPNAGENDLQRLGNNQIITDKNGSFLLQHYQKHKSGSDRAKAYFLLCGEEEEKTCKKPDMTVIDLEKNEEICRDAREKSRLNCSFPAKRNVSKLSCKSDFRKDNDVIFENITTDCKRSVKQRTDSALIDKETTAAKPQAEKKLFGPVRNKAASKIKIARNESDLVSRHVKSSNNFTEVKSRIPKQILSPNVHDNSLNLTMNEFKVKQRNLPADKSVNAAIKSTPVGTEPLKKINLKPKKRVKNSLSSKSMYESPYSASLIRSTDKKSLPRTLKVNLNRKDQESEYGKK